MVLVLTLLVRTFLLSMKSLTFRLLGTIGRECSSSPGFVALLCEGTYNTEKFVPNFISSVMDPDPVGSETFSRIRIRKKSF